MTTFLGASASIGHRLADEAIWHRDQCNWVGPAAETRVGAHVGLIRSLSPDLYGGTAGIGLVLAELWAATGDRRFGRTGRAALRHALAHAPDVPGHLAYGLYTGRCGIAIAALRGGRLLADEALYEAGVSLLFELRKHRGEARDDDLLAGRAGAVVGFLVGAAAADQRGFVAAAEEAASDLLRSAHIQGAGWSWAHSGIKSRGNLTGLSHGASGIAHALQELHAVTGDARLRSAVEGAFAYERSLFDPVVQNWPDLREPPVTGSQRFVTRSVVLWCHGAPGITLARHRGWQLRKVVELRDEAAFGLHRTARWVAAALRTGRESFCLCHGLAGNAEVLWHCADADPQRASALIDLALEVAQFGIDEHLIAGATWPCGPSGGESVDLMLGLAGICRFYLRLEDPTVPSVLLISPADRGWAI